MIRHGISHHHGADVSRAGIEKQQRQQKQQQQQHGSMSLIDALRHVKERRPVVSPNSGFMAQLVSLECELRGEGPTIDLEKYELHGRYLCNVIQCYSRLFKRLSPPLSCLNKQTKRRLHKIITNAWLVGSLTSGNSLQTSERIQWIATATAVWAVWRISGV